MNITNILNHVLNDSDMVTVNGVGSGILDNIAYVILLRYTENSVKVSTGDILLGDVIELGTEREYVIPESKDDEFNKKLINEYVLSYETDVPVLVKLFDFIDELKGVCYFRD